MALDDAVQKSIQPIVIVDNYNESGKFQEAVYSEVLSSITNNEPVIVDVATIGDTLFLEYDGTEIEGDNPFRKDFVHKGIAAAVSEVVGDKFSIMISANHFYAGMCYDSPETVMINFDAHNDSNHNSEDEYSFYGRGSFLKYRKGPSFVLGTNCPSDDKKTKWAYPGRIDKFDSEIPEDVYLSLDIDCYSKDITTAYNIINDFSIFDNFLLKMGINVHLSEKDVLDYSKHLMQTRNVKGIDISEYNPFKEIPEGIERLSDVDIPNLKTVKVLKRYLSGVCGEMYK